MKPVLDSAEETQQKGKKPGRPVTPKAFVPEKKIPEALSPLDTQKTIINTKSVDDLCFKDLVIEYIKKNGKPTKEDIHILL